MTLSPTTPSTRNREEGGFALIVVLIVLLVVAAVATRLARTAKIQSLLAENEKSHEVAEEAARGWVEVVKARLRYDMISSPTVTSMNGRAMSEEVKNYTFEHSGVSIQCEVIDEASKFNLTTLKDADKAKAKLAEDRLRYLLEHYRETELPEADKMIESLKEHFARKSDDDVPVPEMDGTAPPILSIDELLQLEGWDKKYLFDLREEETEAEAEEEAEPVPLPGLNRFLTIHTDGKININTAPKEVLMMLFRNETDPEGLAQAIIEYRQNPEDTETTTGDDAPQFQEFKTVNDLEKVEGIDSGTLAKNGINGDIATVTSSIFSVYVYGSRDEFTLQLRYILLRHPVGFITKLAEFRKDERFEKEETDDEEE